MSYRNGISSQPHERQGERLGKGPLPKTDIGSRFLSQHPLTFRVMRLCRPRPSLRPGIPVTSVPSLGEPCAVAGGPRLPPPPPWEAEGSLCGVGSLTVLPTSFGSIYVGETFRAVVSLCNLMPWPLTGLTINLRLQTPTRVQRPLLPAPLAVGTLAPGCHVPLAVAAPLAQLGVHVLVCSSTYTAQDKPPSFVRQSFRFNALAPLESSVVVRPLEGPPAQCRFLVDVRLTNAMPVPMYFTRAELVPQSGYTVTDMNRNGAEGCKPGVGGGTALGECRRVSTLTRDRRGFLFYVARDDEESEKTREKTAQPKVAQDTSQGSREERKASFEKDELHATLDSRMRRREDGTREIGRLTVEWQSGFGEIGRLDDAVIAHEPVLEKREVDVRIVAVPAGIRTHCLFNARCTAKNNTSTRRRLYLQVKRDLVGEIIPAGVAGFTLGEVDPGSEIECQVPLVSLSSGKHPIMGVRVIDMETNKVYSADPQVIAVS